MKQEELSAILGINVATLSRWENNQNTPNGKRIRQIAEALDVSPEEIVGTHAPQIKEMKEDHGVMRYRFSETEALELPATPEFIPIFQQIISERLKIK